MSRSRRLRLGALAAALLVPLAACTGGDGQDYSGERGDQLTLGIVGSIASWDPSQAHVGHYLQPYQAPYDTLLLRAPDGELEPMLATEWSYNEDNTVLTLELRDDVTFSDGAPFDADAAKANLEAFQSGDGPQAGQLASLESVEATGKTTLELTLTQPDPAMEYYLSQAAGLMASPESLGSADLAGEPAGSGPYVMDADASQDGVYAFTAREGYWNPDLQRYDRLELRVIPDVTDRLDALVAGEVDAAPLDTTTGPEAIEAGMDEYEAIDGWQGLLLLDRDGEVNPALADVRVRQALNYAFDRSAMLDDLMGSHGEVANQVFGASSDAYLPQLDERYPYDPAQAEALLAEAGYGDGLTLTMPEIEGQGAVYDAMASQLAEVGVTLETEPITLDEVYSAIRSKEYPMVWFQLAQVDAWVNINQWIATTATQFNPFASTTPELQDLITQTQTAGEEAGVTAKAINQYVTENAWFVPWYRVDSLYYADPSVQVSLQVEQAVPSIYNYWPAN